MKLTLLIGILLSAALFFIPDISAEELMIFTEKWPPMSFPDKNGKPGGLAVEVVREILRRVNMPDTIKVVPWARGWKMATEKPNVVLFTMTYTEEREHLFTMIGPVAIGTTNFYTKKGTEIKIKNLEDAKRVEHIGVYRSAVEEQILTEAGFTNLDDTTLPLQSAKKLMMGRINLWCNANLTVERILQEAGYTLNDVENVFVIQENRLYIAFSKGTSETIIESWLEAFNAMKEDGTFAKIYKKWLPGEIPPETVERLGGS